MNLDLVRRVALLHALVSWLAAAGLVAIAIVLVRQRDRLSRWVRISAGAATSLVGASFVAGLLLEVPYRAHIRQRLFLASRALGWLFERKLHASFGALVFACLSLAALVAASEDPVGRTFRRTARFGYATAALFSLFACVVGALCAAKMRF